MVGEEWPVTISYAHASSRCSYNLPSCAFMLEFSKCRRCVDERKQQPASHHARNATRGAYPFSVDSLHESCRDIARM